MINVWNLLLQLINIKASKLQQSNDIYQAEHSSSNAENSFVNDFKIADYFFELRATIVCKPECSIVQLLSWNETKSDANIATHLSVGPNVNGQQNLTGFVVFSAVSGGSRMKC